MVEYDKHAETNVQAVGKCYQFLKNTLQTVISVAFLSIFLSHSSSIAYSLFPHSFNVYFSTFLFSLFTHTLERKYMFLVCNGILAFIAKTSHSSVDGGEFDIRHVPLIVEVAEDGCTGEVEARRELENGSLGEEEEEEEEEESEASVVVEDDVNGGGEDKEREKRGSAAKEEQEEGSMSTEDLNRKIEEFIRKMKEEIRLKHNNNNNRWLHLINNQFVYLKEM